MIRATLASCVLSGLITAVSLLAPSTASAAQMQPCAREGEICRLPYPAEVVYGAEGYTTSRFINRPSVPCSNDVFGDPAPGVHKSCYIVSRDRGGDGDNGYRGDDGDGGDRRYGHRPAHWRPCASENGFCDFDGRKRVRYGAEGRFTEDVFEDGVDCDNDTFGDPAPGIPKRCYIQD
ncbi:hypothetical protein QD460_05515 [Rhizobium jaguaris]|uniref:Uncharacterized protein n=2 Tax=Rhizobium jaguaris TaxID=1312183 RepID=A0A387FWI5_9HYPH|nr:hypothetical protein [Rhizobium jaguaris]AYG61585.1 hypothetical protein CCGE525_21025 [Rhizobium jaguaris]